MRKVLFCFPSLLLIIAFVLLFLTFVNMFFCVISAVLFILITLGEFAFYLVTEKGKLDIGTPDGSNEPLHPSVLYMGKEGWNGYKYWMAFTPYPIKSKIYRDRFECPCIIASNDGIKWGYVGEKKYIDDLNEAQIESMDYFSDPELVFDNAEKRLFCYYRLSFGGEGLSNKQEVVYRKSSIDGKTWSERERITFVFDGNIEYLVSPAINLIYSIKYLWFVSGKKWSRKIYRMESDDGLNWSKLIECDFDGFDLDPWHIDCQFINKEYILTIYDMVERITIWKSKDGVNFEFYKLAIEPSRRLYSFYRATLYRASLCHDQKEYKLYFTAGNARKNSIGLMAGTSIDSLKVKSVPFGIYRIKDFISGWVEKYLYPFKVVFMKASNLICRKSV